MSTIVDAETAERIRQAAESQGDSSNEIPGQQTIDGGEVQQRDAPPPDEITVTGTAQLEMFDMGGKRPQSASIRFQGGKVALVHGTAFSKGDVIQFSGTAVVTAIKQQDKRDGATGIVVECEQQHTAHITDLRVA